MKILVINADCLQVNSSANLCHLAYIKGLIDLGHEVSLLSADGKDYSLDNDMNIPKGVIQYSYYGVSLYEKLSLKKNKGNKTIENVSSSNQKAVSTKNNILKQVINKTKKIVLSLYGPHGIYSTFIKKAKKFQSDEIYDYVLSISTPPASHALAYDLIKSRKIKCKNWIQIWEDPWFSDAYGFNGDKRIYKEEKRLLHKAEKICYVSPLTLQNQKKLYPESANKMYWNPLPYYYKSDSEIKITYLKNRYGYFGDYVPAARNLRPFYEAALKTEVEVNICGNPSDLFSTDRNIHIYPRLSLSKLKPIEDNTNVLIFLCNRKGGQIPGKIYQYSATSKIILFILDGTEEEKKILRDYFEPFNRYMFCENTVEDITKAICCIEKGEFGSVKNEPVEAFNPKETIRKVLEGK